ncbi:methyltransferase domain-containing protein [Methanolobus sp. ZRKC3]|uniref:small ribosomal subunit Rsm22 family protein n=1 Tax=Methanolobus sp. ZRKC3 TaxID=3125786 RepID=UPI003249A142
MSEREIISAIKYVSRMKQDFMLSEIRNYIKSEMSTQDIYNIIYPLSFDIGIDVIAQGDDFKVSHAPKGKIELTETELKKNTVFFKSATVSRKLERLIEQYVEKKTAKKWNDPEMLDKIRKAVVAQKSEYWKEGKARNISYEKGYHILGYLAYQFPVYFVQSQHILYKMMQEGLLKKRMTILDVGTGAGTVPLSIVDLYNRLDDHRATIYSIEKYDENIEAYKFLVPEYAGRRSKVSIQEPIKADIKKLDMEKIPDKIDLMVFSNVLNELEGMDTKQKADIVMKLSGKLSEDGNIIIIEPADKVNSIEARKLTIELKERGLGIYGPCSFIWGPGCTPESCWSFEQKPDIKSTRLMQTMADCPESYRYINTDIKYTYAILRKDKLSEKKYRVPSKARFLRFSHLQKHIGKRINVICSLMSSDLANENYSVYKVCDGTSRKSVYAIMPLHNITEENISLRKANYGDILSIENVLVKYNEITDSYNLLVGKGSFIELVEGNL